MRPSRLFLTRPARFRASRCCDTAGCETPARWVSALTVNSPSRTSRSNRARRVGSASVLNNSVWVEPYMGQIHKSILINCQATLSGELAGHITGHARPNAERIAGAAPRLRRSEGKAAGASPARWQLRRLRPLSGFDLGGGNHGLGAAFHAEFLQNG